jgi:hypothetical protein
MGIVPGNARKSKVGRRSVFQEFDPISLNFDNLWEETDEKVILHT